MVSTLSMSPFFAASNVDAAARRVSANCVKRLPRGFFRSGNAAGRRVYNMLHPCGCDDAQPSRLRSNISGGPGVVPAAEMEYVRQLLSLSCTAEASGMTTAAAYILG